jgi:RNA polymerase sigma-70 factor, ECF subfamily
LNLSLYSVVLLLETTGKQGFMANVVDQDLVVQLKAGSLEALGELYDHYQRMVHRTALVITGDHEAAADLSQDVFLRLYRFASHIDAERPLEPWLYRMTVNLSYTWIKRNRHWLQPLEDLADWISGSRPSPSDVVEMQDDWDRVQKAVSRLPFPQRVVIVLYYLNDLSLQDISEILEVPVGTIKSRLHYGRQTLKKNLGIEGFSDNDQLVNLEIKSS